MQDNGSRTRDVEGSSAGCVLWDIDHLVQVLDDFFVQPMTFVTKDEASIARERVFCHVLAFCPDLHADDFKLFFFQLVDGFL